MIRLGRISYVNMAPVRGWSIAAVFFGLLGAACSTVLIAAQPDPWSINWALVLVPVVAVPLVLSARRAVRVVCAAVMLAWCVVAGASIGMFFAPCAALMIRAGMKDEA